MASATPSDSGARHERDIRTYRVAARMSLGATLAVLTAAVATISFAVSFHGLDGYGRHVMRLGDWSPLVPAGIDLAALVALVSAHMRRGGRRGRRLYAWGVFGVTAGLSVLGNLADGMSRGLPTAGLVGMGAAPVVFVLVSHLAITTRRTDVDVVADSVPTPPVEVAAVSPTEATAGATATRRLAPRRRAADPARPATPDRGATSDSALRDEARRLYLAEAPWADIAATVGRDKRTVQRWTADLRQTAPVKAATATTEPAPINGQKVHA